MKRLITLILICISSIYSQEGKLIKYPVRNIPKWVRSEFSNQYLEQRYTIIYNLYPYYLTGDFNGDRKKDVVIQLQDNNSGKIGIGIFHRKKRQALQTQVFILGAGNALKNIGDDFKWIKTWSIYRHPTFKWCITLENKEGNKECIYWNGSKYICESCN